MGRKQLPRYTSSIEVSRLRELGWTISRIAAEVRVTLREVYRWSVGDARPRAAHLERLRELVGPTDA